MADPPRQTTGEKRAVAVEPGEPSRASETLQGAVPMATPRPSMMKRRITRPSFMIDLQEGSPIGDYEVRAQIGEGAMGTVYSAVHPMIGKDVAIKVLKPELCANQVTIDRFVEEARAVNKIGHPNIVDIFNFGELPDGRAFFIMEWLHGEDLKTRLSRGPMAVTDTCDILDGIARALDAAHGKDIVHRDLKPDNVFLHQVDNGPLMVKLLDFGIAKLLRAGAGAKEKTQTGNMLGTPRYISPEQARGVDVDHRADIYSLGVMAYEMLAGRPPFNGETAMDLVVMHLSEKPPELSLFAKVPQALEQCVMRMLEKDPARRPSLTEVRAILVDPSRRVTPVPARISSSITPPRRARWPIAAAGVGAIAMAALTWQLVGSPHKSPPAPPPVVAPPPVAAAAPVVAPVVNTQSGLQVDVKGHDAAAAVIFVDGVQWGLQSQSKLVAPGTHHVEVKAPGIEPLVNDVEVKADQNKSIEFAMPTIVSAPVTVHPPVSRPVKKPPVVVPPPPPTTSDDDLLTPKKRHP